MGLHTHRLSNLKSCTTGLPVVYANHARPLLYSSFSSIFNIDVQSWLTPIILSKTAEASWSSFVLQNLTFSLVSHDIISLHGLNLGDIQPHNWLPGYFPTLLTDPAWSSLAITRCLTHPHYSCSLHGHMWVLWSKVSLQFLVCRPSFAPFPGQTDIYSH